MAVKTYRARSIQEAVIQIKKDLGPEALLLSTKRLPRRAQDPYGKNFFEVTASDHPLPEAPLKTVGNTPEAGKQRADSNLVAYSHRKPDRSPAQFGWQDISAELLSIKEMLFLMNQAGGIPDFLVDQPEAMNLYARLVKAGISERHVKAFMQKGGVDRDHGRLAPEELTQKVVREIFASMAVLNPFETSQNGTHLAAFVGPTGVGKTTTIAKLAAELCLKQKKRVGIISIDGYRIGAVEQLKTYAAIMGLACLPAFTKQDLAIAVRKMQTKDIILIDTAGQSHLDLDRMTELARLIGGDITISSHLVLSVTTKARDMQEAAENFSLLNPQSYIFTKVDETKQRGNMIDQMMKVRLPVSFVTNGQRVPEDILPADKKSILQLILNSQ